MNSKEKVVITGGSGLLGQQLTQLLIEAGFEVVHLSRSPNKNSAVKSYFWDPETKEIDYDALTNAAYIVHLAGAGIADKRWTEQRKKLLIESRTLGPELLKSALQHLNHQPKAFISASGINGYGNVTGEHIFEETDPLTTDFIGECVRLWEEAADLHAEISRVVKLRVAVVLAKDGGALPKLAKPIKMRIGSPLGSGKQWVPWIHIEDVARMFLFAIQNEKMKGHYNAVAPESITNATFTKEVARVLDKKIWMFNVPGFVLKLLFGKMSALVLKGSRASNKKILSEGFEFKFPKMREALEDIY